MLGIVWLGWRGGGGGFYLGSKMEGGGERKTVMRWVEGRGMCY